MAGTLSNQAPIRCKNDCLCWNSLTKVVFEWLTHFSLSLWWGDDLKLGIPCFAVIFDSKAVVWNMKIACKIPRSNDIKEYIQLVGQDDHEVHGVMIQLRTLNVHFWLDDVFKILIKKWKKNHHICWWCVWFERAQQCAVKILASWVVNHLEIRWQENLCLSNLMDHFSKGQGEEKPWWDRCSYWSVYLHTSKSTIPYIDHGGITYG